MLQINRTIKHSIKFFFKLFPMDNVRESLNDPQGLFIAVYRTDVAKPQDKLTHS